MTINPELQQILLRSCSSLGTSFISKGGDKVLAQPSNRMLFAKIGRFGQVMGEAESLNAMQNACFKAGHSEEESLIPTIHTFGPMEDGERAYLVTDYKDLSGGLTPSNQRILGKRLAEMHLNGQSSSGMFGFDRPTHCGSTQQDNTWTQSWPEFWAERRIGDLVRRSGDKELAKLEEQLRKKVYPLIFSDRAMKDVRPAIIHGDLWSGNSGSDLSTGQPIIFDPSSSYSHNEAELGIMKMFGGYGNEFFDGYHQVIPKTEPYYEQRIDMYEAYHHLNHFVIFGGGYRSGTIQMFNKLISWADQQMPSTNEESDNEEQGDARKRRRGLQGGSKYDHARQSRYHDLDGHSGLHTRRSPPPPSDGGSMMNAQYSTRHRMSTSPTVDGTTSDPSLKHKQASVAVPTPAQIADFFSQMVCFIWFSTGLPSRSGPSTPTRSPTSAHQPLQSSPLAPRKLVSNGFVTGGMMRNGQRSHAKVASTSAIQAPFSSSIHSQELSKVMQNHLISTSVASTDGMNLKMITNDPLMQRLQPKGRFLRFIRELLGTTQLSTSVITLALIYVYRLKIKHPHLRGREGSEYRVAISALMLANKILDDNTYLNKTWAEISGMPLVEISKMEVEFWLGLKMEMHISKHDYDAGLHELQLLSNDRTRAIREREAILKNFAVHQQQQQQQQHFANSQHISRSSHLAQNSFSPANSQTPMNMRQSIPNAFQHAWPVMTTNAAQAQMMNGSWGSQAQRVTRHSVGNGEILAGRMGLPRNSLTRPTSPDANLINHSMQAFSPQQHQISYTMPSSPLSQGSGVHSLATASNEALTCTSEVEASTPQDYTSPFGIMDPVFSFAEAYNANNPGLQSQPPLNEQQTGRTISPHTSFSQRSNVFQTVTVNGTEMMINSNQFPLQPPPPPASLTYVPAQSNPSANNYRKEFERPTTGSLSPQDTRSVKRFTAEADGEEDHRIKRTRYSSSGFPSPLEKNNQWVRQQRPVSHSSPFSHVLDHSQQMRASLSPSYAIQFNRLASPSSFATSMPLTQTMNNGNFARMPTPEEAIFNTMGNNIEIGGTNGKETGIRSFGVGQNGYHSVFSSALTPNALAAPLQISNVAQSMFERGRIPLKYYSLAAGEARGNLGHYIPPTRNMSGGYHINRPNVVAREQANYYQNNGISPATYGQAVTNSISPYPAVEKGVQSANLSQYGFPVNDRQNTSSYDSQTGLNKNISSQACHTMATTTPTTEFGLQNSHPWELVPNVGPETVIESHQPVFDGRHGNLPNRTCDPPPFALDPHGWPLADSSNFNTFIFPYHLVPFHQQQA